MHLLINVKFPNNISKRQMGFNSAFKGWIVLLTHSAEGLQVRPSCGSSYKRLLSDKNLWIIGTIIRSFIIYFYMYLKYLLLIRLRCFETRWQNCEKQLLASSFLVNNQLDAQFFFLIYLFQFSTCFEQPGAHHHHHVSVMELGHLLTRSGLTYPEVPSKVCYDSFCQLGNSVYTFIVILEEQNSYIFQTL
jgi:hypothetical protein